MVICGDLTDTGDESEAQILAEELRSCTIPVVAVLGNHDFEKGRHKLIRQIVQKENVHVLDGEAVVVGNIGFAGVKGFGGGFDNHMLSMFGEGAMKAFVQEAVDEALRLDRALARLDAEYHCDKKVAIMHYSPIKETVVGEPEVIWPFLGSSRLAEPLNRRDVAVAFHGHAHVGKLENYLEQCQGIQRFQTNLAKRGVQMPVFRL
jgi:Icc-related predicted phosphoesterase